MALHLERELSNFLRRFIYSALFIHFRRNIEKYCQWKPFFISLFFLGILNLIIFFFSALILPSLFFSSFTVSFIIFFVYWYFRIEHLKSIGKTRNSKYWEESQFWLGLRGWDFEQEVADVFRKNGYKAEVTKGSCDGGVDIIMYKNNLKYIVQCKRYNDHPVTPQELRALWGVKDDFNADIVMMVTTSTITDTGREFVSNKPNFKVLILDDIIRLSKNKTSNNVKKGDANQNYLQRNTLSKNQYKSSLYIAIVMFLTFVILLFLYAKGVIKDIPSKSNSGTYINIK